MFINISLFCSIKCPGSIIIKSLDLIIVLRNRNISIYGGFQTPVEKECLNLLYDGTCRIIICPARGVGSMRLSTRQRELMSAGRLSFKSPCNDKVKRPTSKTAAQRNKYILELADHVLILHAYPGSKTEQMVFKLLEESRPVYTLDDDANNNLLSAGALPVEALLKKLRN